MNTFKELFKAENTKTFLKDITLTEIFYRILDEQEEGKRLSNYSSGKKDNLTYLRQILDISFDVFKEAEASWEDTPYKNELFLFLSVFHLENKKNKIKISREQSISYKELSKWIFWISSNYNDDIGNDEYEEKTVKACEYFLKEKINARQRL